MLRPSHSDIIRLFQKYQNNFLNSSRSCHVNGNGNGKNTVSMESVAPYIEIALR